jgi:hypothetical protein
MAAPDQVVESGGPKGMMRETSLDAYFSLQKLGAKQKQVYDAIKILGCPTDLEIAKFLGYTDPNHVRPRRNDLLKMQFITDCERRICSVSGRLSYSWRIVL